MWNRSIDAAARAARSLPAVRGRGRMAQLLHDRAPARRGTWTIEMRRGHRMVVPANSAQSWSAAFTSTYDDPEIDLLIPYIQPGSLVIDVGASLGFYTVPLGVAAQQVGARVLAIEPVAANCEVIRHNAMLNGLEDVVFVVQCAVGARHGEVTLHVESGGTGNATVVTDLDPEDVERHDSVGHTFDIQAVDLFPLDDLELPKACLNIPCSLMKLDAEGFEMDILLGAESFIATHRPTIMAEVSPTWLATRGVRESAPIDWATAHEYACYEFGYVRRSFASDRQVASLHPLSAEGRRSGSDLMLLPNRHPLNR